MKFYPFEKRGGTKFVSHAEGGGGGGRTTCFWGSFYAVA